jgi:hypothetical protein
MNLARVHRPHSVSGACLNSGPVLFESFFIVFGGIGYQRRH